VWSVCGRDASIMRIPWPNKGCFAMGGKEYWNDVDMLLTAIVLTRGWQ